MNNTEGRKKGPPATARGALAPHLISLREVAQVLPRRREKKVHYSTIYRWATKGARGKVLESQLVGGVRYTTVEALRRFLATEEDSPSRQLQAEDLRRVLYGESP